jgi:hypothetical protein
MDRMRLARTAHTSRPWRIHEIAGEFRVEDVWALPMQGGPDDFPQLVRLLTTRDPSHGSSRIAAALWALRWKLGEWFGWDDEYAPRDSLRDRLPADLRDAPSGPEFDGLPFSPMYLLDDEFAAEIANKTMHGILHLGWVPAGAGSFRAQMAVLVKPNGAFGRAYMAAIRPFRHLIIYPAMLREADRRWRER